MTIEEIKNHLLNNGVKNLKEFGYPDVTTKNILTDEIYKEFFKSMLNKNLGFHDDIDTLINELLLEIDKNSTQ